MTTYDPYQTFKARAQADDIQIKRNNVKEDFLRPLNLGYIVQLPKVNHFDQQYGHPLNLHHPPAYIRPPYLVQTRPPSYLLQKTDDMLVDVAGVKYRNKDLKTFDFKSY